MSTPSQIHYMYALLFFYSLRQVYKNMKDSSATRVFPRTKRTVCNKEMLTFSK